MTIKKFFAWIYVGAIIVSFLIILWHNKSLAGSLWWGYWQSESSIGMWIARGHSSREATLIAILLGNFADLNWWLIVFYVLEAWAPAKRTFKAFWHFTPMEPDLTSWKYRLRYAAIPLVVIVAQGGVWASLMAARFLRLNRWATLALVLVGNTAKNIAWGEFFAFLAKDTFLKRNIGYAAFALSLIATVVTIAKIVKKIRTRAVSSTMILPPDLEPED